MKKSIMFLIIILCLINFSTVMADEFQLQSKSAILIEAESGEIIYEKNSHEKLAPASITKIMTMLLVMEAEDKGAITFQDQVVISRFAANMGGSQLYLEPFEKRTVEELLTGVAVESANDAAVALAEYIAGDYELFINKMNERAKELGMNETNFVNPNGLPDENHYTTAYDISLMSKELVKYPKIHNYLTIWMKDITIGKENDKLRTLANTNKLLRLDDKVDGIKTGYTSDAGYCLSATAKMGNMRLISVVLNSPKSDIRFQEADRLLNYGFNRYKKEVIVQKNEVMGEIDISKGEKEKIEIITEEGFSRLLTKDQKKEYEKEIVINDKCTAPLKKGDKIGELIIKENKTVISKINLIASEDINKIKYFNLFKKLYGELFAF